jgi:WD40 repeat protein
VASTAEESAIRQLLFGDQQDLVHAVGYEGVYVRPLRSPTPGILRHEAGQYPFVYGVDFDPSGRHLASAGWDGRVRIWDSATERQVAVLDCPPNAVWVEYSPDGRRILAFSQLGYGTHRLTSWDAVSLRQQGAREVLTISPSACFLPARGDVLVGNGSWEVGESVLEVLDPTSLEVRGQLETRAPVWCMALSPDGVRVAYGMNDGNLALLDAGSLELLRTFGAHEGGVRSIAWSPDGRQLATGGRDGVIEIRDAETARLLRRMESGGGELFALRFTPDGARILAGSRRHAIGVWDSETGLEVVSLHGHESYVHDLALSPDGRVLASASGDNTVRLWDARPLEERLEARDRMLAAERLLRERVLRSVAELGSVEAAARALAADPALGALERVAAWNALQLSQAGERRTSVQ